ncbi:MAG: zinc dependent phospholipase C family protein [Desulfobacteraceae bacterium]|nr:zinc dependent phospholipase C family protein [Desulfobacteraceae bacterium]
MPKERFHLFLADTCFRSLRQTLPASVRINEFSFLIGALSPDIFFYDIPSFSLSPMGNALHDLIDKKGIAPIEVWLADMAGKPWIRPSWVNGFHEETANPDTRMSWGMGFACHFLADAIWHPVIDRLSRTLDFCEKKRLRPIDCHRLLECELEGYWLDRSKNPQFYTGLLRVFMRDREWLLRIAGCYRSFLEHTGFVPAPSEARIAGCYQDQNFLLRLFSNRTLGYNRDRLLASGPTRRLGALVVPVRPLLPEIFSSLFSDEENLFSEKFLSGAIFSIESRLCELSERLSPFLPS